MDNAKGMTFAIMDPVLRLVCRTAGICQCARRTLTASRDKRYRPEQHYMRGPGPKYRAARKDATDRSTSGANGRLNGK